VDLETIRRLIATLTDIAHELPHTPEGDHARERVFWVMAELEREGRFGGYVTRARPLGTDRRRAGQAGGSGIQHTTAPAGVTQIDGNNPGPDRSRVSTKE
jgi:hypothetical protein